MRVDQFPVTSKPAAKVFWLEARDWQLSTDNCGDRAPAVEWRVPAPPEWSARTGHPCNTRDDPLRAASFRT